MSIITLAEAKLHLRVDGTDEDALIQSQINAAEATVAFQLDRDIYADASALASAIAAAPAALTTARQAYEAAMLAADAITDEVEQQAAIDVAQANFAQARAAHRRSMNGLVMNETVRAAALLLAAHLYAHREAVVAGVSAAQLPMGAQFLLDQYRGYA